MEVLNTLTRAASSGLEYVNGNRVVSSVLGLFLVLYASLAAPKLPKTVTQWFDNVWFKLGFMFMIAYMATRDPSVAIIAAVALLVTLQTLSSQKAAESVVEAVQTKVEGFRSLTGFRENFGETAGGETEVTGTEANTGVIHAPVDGTVERQPELEVGMSESAPPSCAATTDEMSGYEAGELATF